MELNFKRQLAYKTKPNERNCNRGKFMSVDGVKIKDIMIGNKRLKSMEVGRDPALSYD